MTRKVSRAIIFLVFFALIFSGLSADNVIYPKKYQKQLRCVGKIEHFSPEGRIWGSGVLTEHGVLSANHILGDKELGDIIVHFQDGMRMETRTLKLIWADEQADLALFQLVTPMPKGWGYIKIAKKYKVGAEISFIGFNSAGFARLRFDRVEENIKYGTMLKPIWFGDSGGGVFNKSGKLLGIIGKLLFNDFRGYPVATMVGYASSLDEIHKFFDDYQEFLRQTR